ncbi:MAG: CBS domain-containing protein, partial [Chitinophagaceae bacterium]
MDFSKHIIKNKTPLKLALAKLNDLAADAVLFVVDEEEKLVGSLTDGDIRRGVLQGLTLDDIADKFSQPKPRYLRQGNHSIEDVIFFRENHIQIVPVLNADGRIADIVNLRSLKSYLPIDAVIMAGGRGERLIPLTDSVPKPLLKIGGHAIIEHNLKRLAAFGINKFWISLGYLGEQVEDYFNTVEKPDLDIQFIWEEKPLGTIGAVSKIKAFHHDYVLITNSDLLTNIDYEHFFLYFLEHEADVAIVSIPYQVSVPY